MELKLFRKGEGPRDEGDRESNTPGGAGKSAARRPENQNEGHRGENRAPLDIDRLYDLYADTVYRLALARTRGASDAEDILQEVFMRCLRARPTFVDGEHEKAWFIRVTINCSKTLVTSAWRRHTAPELENERAAEEPEDYRDVWEAVMALPVKYRTVVHLFYYERYSVTEIASLTGATENTVKSQLFRAREMLRGTLKGEYAYETV